MFGWVPGVPSGTHLTRIFGDAGHNGECRVDRCSGTCGPRQAVHRAFGTTGPQMPGPVT
jgi:hypothetical protein